MSPRTLLGLAAAGGRGDAIRIALTAVATVLGTCALLSAATVLAIVNPEQRGTLLDGQVFTHVPDLDRYTSDLLNAEAMRERVVLGLLLLTIPVLALVAQCGKLGASARERRLAAFRLAGASPRQVVRIAATETGLASLLGVGLGVAGYFVGRALLDGPDAQGRRPLPTDVVPEWTAFVVIAVAVPVFVTLLATLALRRVAVTPLGVVRRSRRRAPSRWPSLLIGAGIACYAVLEPLDRLVDTPVPEEVVGGLLVGGMALVCIGVVTGTGWLTHLTGRILHRLARQPAALLAGRRMQADPWAGSRTFAALLVVLVLGALTAGVYAYVRTGNRAEQLAAEQVRAQVGRPPGTPVASSAALITRSAELVNYAVAVAVVIAAGGLLVALADGIVARRRTLTALIASGTPRLTLARATAWQTLTPIVPASVIALSAGAVLPRSIHALQRVTATASTSTRCTPAPGDPADACRDPAYHLAHTRSFTATVTLDVPIPWQQLALLAAGAVIAAIAVTALGLLFLRVSTHTDELRVG